MHPDASRSCRSDGRRGAGGGGDHGRQDGPRMLVGEVWGQKSQKGARVAELKGGPGARGGEPLAGSKVVCVMGRRGASTQRTGRRATRVRIRAHGRPPSLPAGPRAAGSSPCPPRGCGVAATAPPPPPPPRLILPAERRAAGGREARTLGPPGRRAPDGEVEPPRQQRQPPPVGSARRSPARAGRGLARGTVGKAWTARPGRTRTGLGRRRRPGKAGRRMFRLTWRSARNPAPVPTRS